MKGPATQEAQASIFAVMSALAKQHGAINLSQGFPDFPMSGELIRLAAEAMAQGHNQYAPMPGVFALREQIARKAARCHGFAPDPEREITITPGATCALFTAIQCSLRPGDEVVFFEPAYDSYLPAIQAAGGVPVPLPLQAPGFRIDWDAVRDRLSPRTRLLLLNNPHNPSGAVLGAEDLAQLSALAAAHDFLILGDEVYEHLVFDGRPHLSLLRYPELYARSFVVFSFGKLFHNTGWKTGYCIAPPPLTAAFRRLYQFICFSAHTPAQHALAAYLARGEEVYAGLGAFFAGRRALFAERMAGSRFRLLPVEGTYFMLADYGRISGEPDQAFARRLTMTHGVASIPLSSFYREGSGQRLLRFCFAKKEETLMAAAERLCAV